MFMQSLEVDLELPQAVLIGLPMQDLQDLRGEIEGFIHLGANDDYWRPLLLLCEREELVADERRRSHNSLSREQAYDRVAARLASVRADAIPDIRALLESRSLKGLRTLEGEVQGVIERARRRTLRQLGGAAAAPSSSAMTDDVDIDVDVDVVYWQAVLLELQQSKARAALALFHKRLLRLRLTQLKLEAAAARGKVERGAESNADADEFSTAHAVAMGADEVTGAGDDVAVAGDPSAAGAAADANAEPEPLPPSPSPVFFSDLTPAEADDVVALEDLLRTLAAQREVVLDQQVQEAIERLQGATSSSSLSSAAMSAAEAAAFGRVSSLASSLAAAPSSSSSSSSAAAAAAAGGPQRFTLEAAAGEGVPDGLGASSKELELFTRESQVKLAADEELFGQGDVALTAQYRWVFRVASFLLFCWRVGILLVWSFLTLPSLLSLPVLPLCLRREQLAGQVPAAQAALLQQGQDRLRLEQVQQDPLRQGQPAAEDRSGACPVPAFSFLASVCVLGSRVSLSVG